MLGAQRTDAHPYVRANTLQLIAELNGDVGFIQWMQHNVRQFPSFALFSEFIMLSTLYVEKVFRFLQSCLN